MKLKGEKAKVVLLLGFKASFNWRGKELDGGNFEMPARFLLEPWDYSINYCFLNVRYLYFFLPSV